MQTRINNTKNNNQNNPLLLLSFPRSGSSWVGEVLGTSPDCAYLREPLTQFFLNKTGTVLFDPSRVGLEGEFRRLSARVFAGNPPISLDTVGDVEKFVARREKGKRLLIKEVNLMATSLIVQFHRSKTIVLLRHPAAIAESFLRLGWLRDSRAPFLSYNDSPNVLTRFGFSYGKLMRDSLNVIQDFNRPMIIRYEELALNPYGKFKNIFDELKLSLPRSYNNVIKYYCMSDDSVPQGPYSTRRKTEELLELWKNRLSPEQIAQVREGYLQSGFPYYRSDKSWRVEPN